VNRRNFLVAAAALSFDRVRSAVAGERCTLPDPMNGMTACEVGIPSWEGARILRRQPHLSQWCWAACMEMVFAHYGYTVPMERIVEEVYGSRVNLPAMSWTIVQHLSRTWEAEDGQSFDCQCDVLWDASTGVARPAPDQIASQYLNLEMPLIIGTLGHAMVLTALSYTKHAIWTNHGWVMSAVVRDPYPGRGGRRVLTPREWFATQFLVAPLVEAA
jgi:hypothetical protein